MTSSYKHTTLKESKNARESLWLCPVQVCVDEIGNVGALPVALTAWGGAHMLICCTEGQEAPVKAALEDLKMQHVMLLKSSLIAFLRLCLITITISNLYASAINLH